MRYEYFNLLLYVIIRWCSMQYLTCSFVATVVLCLQIARREVAYVAKPDDVKVWADGAIKDGRKLFISGAGGFHFA